MPTFEGLLDTPQGRFAVVASKFNREIVDRLVEGATGALRRHGVADSAIDLVWVPGAFEIPATAKLLIESTTGYAALICLGAVIRGDTDHYDYVCTAATEGILQVGLASISKRVPVLFGVLTCDPEEPALDRAGGKAGNKGADVAEAAIEMGNLLRRLPESSGA